MQITLAPEQEKIVRRLMESGKYENAAAAVADAVRIVEEDYDLELMMPKAVVKAKIQEGIDSLDRGEGIELRSESEVDEFFEGVESRGRKRLAKRDKARRP